MVLTKKDTDSTKDRNEEFEFFLEHREEFLQFMDLEQDVLQYAFFINELANDDIAPDGIRYIDKFKGAKNTGYRLLTSMAGILQSNLDHKRIRAMEIGLEKISLLSFYGLSKIWNGDLKDPEDSNQLNLKLTGDLPNDPGDEEDESLLKAPDINTLEDTEYVFHSVYANGYRIEVSPINISAYDGEKPGENIHLSYNAELALGEGRVIQLIRYTKNRLVNLGKYIIRTRGMELYLEESLPEIKIRTYPDQEEETMSVITITVDNPVKFLKNPFISVERDTFIKDYGFAGLTKIYNVQNKNKETNTNWTLGRWRPCDEHSTIKYVMLVPVKKTMKKLVSHIRNCFPNLDYGVAYNAFQDFKNKNKNSSILDFNIKENISVLNINASKTTDKVNKIPDHIELYDRGIASFNMEYIDSDVFKLERLNTCTVLVCKDGSFVIPSGSHLGDFNKVSKAGNGLVKITVDALKSQIDSINRGSQALIRNLYDANLPEVTRWEKHYRTSIFDEGIIFNPIQLEDESSILLPKNFFFRTFSAEANGNMYYPKKSFNIQELSDSKFKNTFVGFNYSNLQNWKDFLDDEDFSNDFENSDELDIILDDIKLGKFSNLKLIGNMAFMFRGDLDSKIYQEALFHMAQYEKVYHYFLHAEYKRMVRVGTDAYDQLTGASIVGAGPRKKKLVKPPKRKSGKLIIA